MKTIILPFRLIFLIYSIMLFAGNGYSQDRQRLAIIGIDSKELTLNSDALTSLVHLEVEKTGKYELMDKYDVSDVIKSNDIDKTSCYGKTCLIKAGKLLKADKMLTGSAEKFGNKIIIVLKLINVNSEIIEKTDVSEYINQQEDIQVMIRLSVNNLFAIPNDQKIVDMLVNFGQPITSPKTKVNLNGPRMGASMIFGEYADRMKASKDEGGFDMYPLTSMFGYQREVQYLSAGDFQALIEIVGAVNGMESGHFFPSVMFMNGFRFNKSGVEFGLGPVFRTTLLAKGYFDENGKWFMTDNLLPDQTQYKLVETMDRRGTLHLSTSLILAVGKTFKSGYLNVPVNFYFSPRKQGSIVGFSFGFNIAKDRK